MLRLIDYQRAKYAAQGKIYEVKPHTIEMCNALELCIAGALPDGKQNLIINVPPRFGKTDLLEGTAEWSWGHVPDSQYIFTSYAQSKASDSSTNIRSNLRQPWFEGMFPLFKVAPSVGRDSQKDTQDEFHSTMGGGLLASGVGGPIMGFGSGLRRPGFAGFFGIDDAIKAYAARRSPTMRQAVIDWYTGEAKNRKNKSTTPYIHIAQRVHQDDLTSWLLKNEPDLWHQVKIAAHDRERDISIDENLISLADLKLYEQVDPFTYWALYQQEPRAPGGSILKEEYWGDRFYIDVEEVKKRCDFFLIFADTAMKTKEHNDYSVFQLWGFESNKAAYLIDQIRGKWEFPELVEFAKAFWAKHTADKRNGPQMIYIEDRSSGTSLIQTLQSEGLPVEEWLPSDYELDHDDKVSRARAAGFLIYGGKVWLPDPTIAPWINAFLDECNAFQGDMSHSHDDQVDTLSMAVLTWKSFF